MQGDVVVLTGVATAQGEDGVGGAVVLRSEDAGQTWAQARRGPPLEGADSWLPVYAGGGRFFTVVSSFVEAWRDPELCYADITLCQQDNAEVLYVSDDGDRWRRVDTSGIGTGEAGEVDLITGTADGKVVAFTRVVTRHGVMDLAGRRAAPGRGRADECPAATSTSSARTRPPGGPPLRRPAVHPLRDGLALVGR